MLKYKRTAKSQETQILSIMNHKNDAPPCRERRLLVWVAMKSCSQAPSVQKNIRADSQNHAFPSSKMYFSTKKIEVK